jgi:hypothetical protein
MSIDPLEWICPLLAIDANAFNHGGTPEFAAICAVARRHNDISRVLSTTPDLRGGRPTEAQSAGPSSLRRLRGWACRTRTGESVRALSDWNSVTTSFEIGASLAVETLRVQAA